MEYLIKASSVVAIFYICYKLFLQRETFFQSNRWFLLTGIFVGICLPFIVIPIYITKEAPIALSNSYYPIVESNNALLNEETFNIWNLIPYIYVIGVLICSIKFILEFSSLLKLVLTNRKVRKYSYSYILTNEDVSPFSFFKWIVYNPSQFNSDELKQNYNT